MYMNFIRVERIYWFCADIICWANIFYVLSVPMFVHIWVQKKRNRCTFKSWHVYMWIWDGVKKAHVLFAILHVVHVCSNLLLWSPYCSRNSCTLKNPSWRYWCLESTIQCSPIVISASSNQLFFKYCMYSLIKYISKCIIMWWYFKNLACGHQNLIFCGLYAIFGEKHMTLWFDRIVHDLLTQLNHLIIRIVFLIISICL